MLENKMGLGSQLCWIFDDFLIGYERILSSVVTLVETDNEYRVTMVVWDWVLLTSLLLFHCLPNFAWAGENRIEQKWQNSWAR